MLLSTPLALSIRAHLPGAAVDYLVFEGTEGVLAANPYVRTVHTIPPGSRSLRRYAALWNAYDYAVASNPSDRSAIHTFGAGRISIGFSYFRGKEWWKRRLLSVCRFYDDTVHIVPLILSQLEPLGIPRRARVVAAFDASDAAFAERELGRDDYVLLHPYAGRAYKRWTPRGWGALARSVRERAGLRPVFTVSPASPDRAVLEEILHHAPPEAEAFRKPFTLAELAAAIRGGRGFVGVDTVATHMAAALEVPTVAIFGPSLVRHWGPWPNGSAEPAPYSGSAGVQRKGRVAVVQKDWSCVPCNRETCSLTDGGRTECLAALTADEVFETLLETLSAG